MLFVLRKKGFYKNEESPVAKAQRPNRGGGGVGEGDPYPLIGPHWTEASVQLLLAVLPYGV